MVSLCALQIEIADDAEPISDIDFNCGRSIEDCLENLTMSTQLPKPVRSQSLRERARGNRKMSDVTIETYTDFDAAVVQHEVCKGLLVGALDIHKLLLEFGIISILGDAFELAQVLRQCHPQRNEALHSVHTKPDHALLKPCDRV